MKRNGLQVGLALALAGGLCALAPFAAAQDESKLLYKCIDAKGVTSIQAKKCPAGSTEAWRRDAQTEPKPTPAQVAAAREREARNQQEVQVLSAEVQRKLDAQRQPPPPTTPPEGSHLAGATNPPEGSHRAPVVPGTPTAPEGSHRAPVVPPAAPDPTSLTISGCQSAQAFATSVREKQWLGLSDDQTRRLFAWVADQCRVNTAAGQ